MRLLISAYACQPNRGSEPEAGLQTVLAAASEHQVWIITRENNLAALRAFLSEHPLKARINLVGLDINGVSRRLKKKGGLVTLHWYYDAWQRRLAKLATDLDEQFDFDLVHHVTFAAYWTRVGIAAVDKPLVWGPTGGGVRPPGVLLPAMGLSGAVGDLIRIFSRPLVAVLNGAKQTADRASVLLVQNPETAKRLNSQNTAVVLPNALLAAREENLTLQELHHQVSQARIIAAGRLIGLKGTELAIRAMAHIRHPKAILEIYGEGPQRARLEDCARRAGVIDRVQFRGTISRGKLLAEIASASALVHPALHEEAGFVVAEALALGTPLVCLNRGGPPVLTGWWPDVPSRIVDASTTGRTARRIALALDELIGRRGEPNSLPARQFEAGLLAAYAEAASRS